MSPGDIFQPWEATEWTATTGRIRIIVTSSRKPRQPRLLDWLAFFTTPEVEA